MGHIDPLTLTRQINLRCFGEVFQEKFLMILDSLPKASAFNSFGELSDLLPSTDLEPLLLAPSILKRLEDYRFSAKPRYLDACAIISYVCMCLYLYS